MRNSLLCLVSRPQELQSWPCVRAVTRAPLLADQLPKCQATCPPTRTRGCHPVQYSWGAPCCVCEYVSDNRQLHGSSMSLKCSNGCLAAVSCPRLKKFVLFCPPSPRFLRGLSVSGPTVVSWVMTNPAWVYTKLPSHSLSENLFIHPFINSFNNS